MEHSHLKRLERIWIENPVFFVTVCTYDRRKILANPAAFGILVDEWKSANERRDWHVGCFMIMPNHVHFFCAPGDVAPELSVFMKFWKEWTSKRIKKVCNIEGRVWQPEFFDHVLRNEENYDEKLNYVINNPVRAGYVRKAIDWQWQGEIEIL